MSGAIPPLPQYAYMEWCSAKAQRQLYLFTFTLPCTTQLVLIFHCCGWNRKFIL